MKKRIEEKNIDEIIKENMARHEEIMQIPLGILVDKLGLTISELVDMIDLNNKTMHETIIDASRMHEVLVEKLQSKNGSNIVERTSVNYIIDQTIEELQLNNSLFGRESIPIPVMIAKLEDIKTFVGLMV